MQDYDKEKLPIVNRGYAPIRDYAVIGDCHTIALVSKQGSIDWLCLPHFSGPSIFGALLDTEKGGRFAVRPRDVLRVDRSYLQETNVLRTTFVCRSGTLQLTDFITVLFGKERDLLQPELELVRLVECIEGETEFDVIYQPRPNYARYTPTLVNRGRLGWLCSWGGLAAFLQADFELKRAARDMLAGHERLENGDRRQLVFSYCENGLGIVTALGANIEHRLQSTLGWWTSWRSQFRYEGKYRERVLRSCLTLKLLNHCLTGAVVAAATTSLPVGDTGDRNWDYRYCWLRDTSLVLQSFVDLGFYSESDAFLNWMLHATRLTQPRLQVMYDVYGETDLNEQTLPHLEGYQGKAPVRVGNGAHCQLQLDIYGDTVQTVFDYCDRGGLLDRYERNLVKGFGQSVLALWRRPDMGIWEIRSEPRHNTYSKLMCWVALDRILQLEQRIGLGIDIARYRNEADLIRADIDRNGFNVELNSYVGYYGGREADASLLLLARYGYLGANDPRMIGTYRYIMQQLSVDGLLYRYPPGPAYDGVPGEENLFGVCSFWLVDYLARLGEFDQATELFEKLLGLGNDVGLYSEEFNRHSGQPCGNFPQAFTHVGLITAALALEQAWQGKRGDEISR